MKNLIVGLVVLMMSVNAQANCSDAPHVLGASSQHYGMGEHGYATSRYSSTTSKALRMQNCIHFDFDKTKPLATPAAVYQAYSQYLILHPKKRLRLTGYTDARGPASYNLKLGNNRARSVADELAKAGLSPTQIELVSCGNTRLLDNRDNERVHARNRRVEISLV